MFIICGVISVNLKIRPILHKFIPVLAMLSCYSACVGSFAFNRAVFQRFGDKIHNNAITTPRLL